MSRGKAVKKTVIKINPKSKEELEASKKDQSCSILQSLNGI